VRGKIPRKNVSEKKTRRTKKGGKRKTSLFLKRGENEFPNESQEKKRGRKKKGSRRQPIVEKGEKLEERKRGENGDAKVI